VSDLHIVLGEQQVAVVTVSRRPALQGPIRLGVHLRFLPRHTRVARAVIESIAYQMRDVDAMQKDAGIKLRSLSAAGSATRNDQLMRFQANILTCTLLRNSWPEVFAARRRVPGRAGNRLLVGPGADCSFAATIRTLRAENAGFATRRALRRLASRRGAG
jgi:FGGY family of carbohydrate kinases, C-terminal domain